MTLQSPLRPLEVGRKGAHTVPLLCLFPRNAFPFFCLSFFCSSLLSFPSRIGRSSTGVFARCASAAGRGETRFGPPSPVSLALVGPGLLGRPAGRLCSPWCHVEAYTLSRGWHTTRARTCKTCLGGVVVEPPAESITPPHQVVASSSPLGLCPETSFALRRLANGADDS